MTQLNSIQINGFQKDVFAVFNKYGMGYNEAFRLLKNITIKETQNSILDKSFGILSDGKLSTQKFIEQKQIEKELEC
jgi:thermostable 8-oxoguanine DNA glycosylase